MKFLIATTNENKVREIGKIIEPLGVECIIASSLQSPLPEVEENGTTFEENAMLKAKSAFEATGIPSIADDSGLCVDALFGAPGIYSARYSGHYNVSSLNNEKLLKELETVPDDKRGAQFVCAIACVIDENTSFVVKGICEGTILREPMGTNGFGYDPLFMTELGCFGEIPLEEKSKISHRGRAIKALCEKLKEYIKE